MFAVNSLAGSGRIGIARLLADALPCHGKSLGLRVRLGEK
jgi:hypothetical protein